MSLQQVKITSQTCDGQSHNPYFLNNKLSAIHFKEHKSNKGLNESGHVLKWSALRGKKRVI